MFLCICVAVISTFGRKVLSEFVYWGSVAYILRICLN